MVWMRGKRVSALAVGYLSRCGRYRVDRVSYGERTFFRAMVRFRVADSCCWERLEGRRTHRSRAAAEAACERHARLPACSKVEFYGEAVC
jgi:hypothetical protein